MEYDIVYPLNVALPDCRNFKDGMTNCTCEGNYEKCKYGARHTQKDIPTCSFYRFKQFCDCIED